MWYGLLLRVKPSVNIVVTLCTTFKNKAKAISPEILVFKLKNKMEETGKTG